jgi:hypothetical protein
MEGIMEYILNEIPINARKYPKKRSILFLFRGIGPQKNIRNVLCFGFI